MHKCQETDISSCLKDWAVIATLRPFETPPQELMIKKSNSFLTGVAHLARNNTSFVDEPTAYVPSGSNIYGYKVIAKLVQQKIGTTYVVSTVLGHSLIMKVIPIRFERSARWEYAILQDLKDLEICPLPVNFLHPDRHFCCIITSYLPYYLRQYCRESFLQKKQIQSCFRHLVELLAKFHGKKYIHGRLSPDAVVLKNFNRLDTMRLCTLCKASKQPLLKYRYNIQVPGYRAPEIIQEQPYNHKIDIWALGCIFYEMLAGKPLFGNVSDDREMLEILRLVGHENITVVDGIYFQLYKQSYYNIHKEVLNSLGYNEDSLYLPTYTVIKEMKNVNKKAPDLKAAVNKRFPGDHETQEQALELLHGMLQYSMDKRWDCDKILSCDFITQAEPDSSHTTDIIEEHSDFVE